MAPTPIVHELDVVKLRYGQTLECAQRVRAAPLKPLDFTAMRVHCGPRSLFTAPSSAGVKASKAIDAPTKFSSITICATLSSSVAKSALGVLLFSCVTSAAAAPEAAASAAVSSPLWLLESIPPLQLAIAAAAVLLVGLYLSGVIEFDSGIWHQWKGPTFLNKKRQTITLAEREMVTHDVVRLKFALPEGTAIGLPVGQATKFYMPNIADDHETWNPRPAGGGRSAAPRCDGSGPGDLDMDGEWKKEIMRKYTPSTLDSHVGYVEYLIKVYGPQREGFFAAAFPDGGKASQYLRSLEIGDTLALQGPVGHLQYFGRGKWKKYGTRMKIGLLAGGSGVTPMLQVIQAVLSDPRDNTRLSLVYANKTVADIIVKEMLDEWAAKETASGRKRFTVHYTLDSPPREWDGSTGFINTEMIAAHLPAPSRDTLVLMCGPPPMIKYACKPSLEKLGYNAKEDLGEF